MKWLAGAWNSLPDWGKVVFLVLIFALICYGLYLGLDLSFIPKFLTGN